MNLQERRKYNLIITLLVTVMILVQLPAFLVVAPGLDMHPGRLVRLAPWPMGMLTGFSVLIELAVLTLAHRLPAGRTRTVAYAWGVFALVSTVAITMLWLLS